MARHVDIHPSQNTRCRAIHRWCLTCYSEIRMQNESNVVRKRAIALAGVLLGGVCLAVLISCSSGHFRAAASSSSPRLSLHRCELPDVEGDVLCGTYEVFEDRAAKSGRTIKLKIVVLKSLGSKPAPDAIFPLHGGPGAPATALVEMANAKFLGRSGRTTTWSLWTSEAQASPTLLLAM